MNEQGPEAGLRPYVPRLLLRWAAEEPATQFKEVDGSIALVDLSGFTAMSERLARKGKLGAEEVTEVIERLFTQLLAVAYGNGGGLIKFGGDALLLLFTGAGHEAAAARSAHGMRASIREIGRVQTSVGAVTLRMSAGLHSGRFLFVLAGESHRELIVTGRAASTVVAMEKIAQPGPGGRQPGDGRSLAAGGARRGGRGRGSPAALAPRARYRPGARPGACRSRPRAVHPARAPPLPRRRRRRARASLGQRCVRARRGRRRARGEEPLRRRGSPRRRRRGRASGGRPPRDDLPRQRHRRGRDEAHPRRRRTESRRRRRGAPAPHAARACRGRVAPAALDRRQPGARVRGIAGTALPPDLHRNGRRGEPGSAADGRGGGRPGARDRAAPRQLARLLGRRASSLPGEGQARAGARVRGPGNSGPNERRERREPGAAARGARDRAAGGRRGADGRPGGVGRPARGGRAGRDRQDEAAAGDLRAGRRVHDPEGRLRAVHLLDPVRALHDSPSTGARRSAGRESGGGGRTPALSGPGGAARNRPLASAPGAGARRRRPGDTGGRRARPGVPAGSPRRGDDRSAAAPAPGPDRPRDRGRPLAGRRVFQPARACRRRSSRRSLACLRDSTRRGDGVRRSGRATGPVAPARAAPAGRCGGAARGRQRRSPAASGRGDHPRDARRRQSALPERASPGGALGGRHRRAPLVDRGHGRHPARPAHARRATARALGLDPRHRVRGRRAPRAARGRRRRPVAARGVRDGRRPGSASVPARAGARRSVRGASLPAAPRASCPCRCGARAACGSRGGGRSGDPLAPLPARGAPPAGLAVRAGRGRAGEDPVLERRRAQLLPPRARGGARHDGHDPPSSPGFRRRSGTSRRRSERSRSRSTPTGRPDGSRSTTP